MTASLPFLIRATTLLVFAYVAISDVRSRTAPNRAWTALAIVGALALALELVNTTDRLATVAAVAGVVLIISSIAIVGYQQGLIGGADAKASMVIPIVFPHLPGEAFRKGVFGMLTQGVEVVIWVWIGTAIVGLWWPLSDWVFDADHDGIPVLLPIFIAIVALFAVATIGPYV